MDISPIISNRRPSRSSAPTRVARGSNRRDRVDDSDRTSGANSRARAIVAVTRVADRPARGRLARGAAVKTCAVVAAWANIGRVARRASNGDDRSRRVIATIRGDGATSAPNGDDALTGEIPNVDACFRCAARARRAGRRRTAARRPGADDGKRKNGKLYRVRSRGGASTRARGVRRRRRGRATARTRRNAFETRLIRV